MSLVAPERAPEIRTISPAFLVDTQGGVACGVYRVTLQIGHQEIRIPCGHGRHVPSARGVVEALVRGAASAPFHRPRVNCRAHRPGRNALEAAVRANPGLRCRIARLGGGTAGDAGLRSLGLPHGWDQNIEGGIGPSLDAISMGDLQQGFATGKKALESSEL